MKIVVTGSKGLIARELIQLLVEKYPDAHILCADIGNEVSVDLRDGEMCEELCNGADWVFHLAGIKGSPKRTNEKPIDFMVPMLQFDTNMIASAQKCYVKKFLYTSSIAVLNPESDKYPAWAKQTSEKVIEAMGIQYPEGTEYCVVRPTNVYGRFDNFEAKDCMVVSDLCRKAKADGKLEVWGDGSQTRDFMNAKDCARAMILVMEKMPNKPINLGTGKMHSIKDVADIIQKELNIEVTYDNSKKNMGAKNKGMDITELEKLGFKPEVDLETGVKEVLNV